MSLVATIAHRKIPVGSPCITSSGWSIVARTFVVDVWRLGFSWVFSHDGDTPEIQVNGNPRFIQFLGAITHLSRAQHLNSRFWGSKAKVGGVFNDSIFFPNPFYHFFKEVENHQAANMFTKKTHHAVGWYVKRKISGACYVTESRNRLSPFVHSSFGCEMRVISPSISHLSQDDMCLFWDLAIPNLILDNLSRGVLHKRENWYPKLFVLYFP